MDNVWSENKSESGYVIDQHVMWGVLSLRPRPSRSLPVPNPTWYSIPIPLFAVTVSLLQGLHGPRIVQSSKQGDPL